MLPLMLVALVTVTLHAIGTRGRSPGRTWRTAALHAVSVVSIVSGAAVFTRMGDDMARMLPDTIAQPKAWVIAAGTLQIAAGIALWAPATRAVALGVLGGLVIAKIPANLTAMREGLWVRGPLPTPPWMRIPDTVIWLALLGWIMGSRGHAPSGAGDAEAGRTFGPADSSSRPNSSDSG